MNRLIKSMMAPLERRVRNMIVRGVITLVNDTGLMQEVQANFLADETHEKLQRIQNYGFTSHPPAGSECIAIFPDGIRDHGVVLGIENRANRKNNLLEGDVALYTSNNNHILLKANGDVVISSLTGNVRIEGNTIELHALTSLKFDCLGHGYHYQPTHVDTYIMGASSTVHSVNPLEIP